MKLFHKMGANIFVIVLGTLLPTGLGGRAPQTGTEQIARVEKAVFGEMADGTAIEAYTLRNKNGLTAKLITYGATLTELLVPGSNGKPGDVVLGFDNLQGYLGEHPFFGSTVGRYANRIANGRFTIDGKQYQLAINNPPNTLHGGKIGFNRKVWKGEPLDSAQAGAVRFSYVSKDGEENFPGTLKVGVTYTLTDANELKIEYAAETDKATVINLTNHSYFNLAGSANILSHVLYLNADQYTPVDATLIPTGEIQSVANTPLDFRKPTPMGAHIGELKQIGGYDHNYVLNGKAGTLRLIARVHDPSSGREMEVWTTEPGVQFYSAIHLDGSTVGKGGVAYQKYGAFCLETQHYPDSPNHPSFPSTTLRPGEKFRSETVYKFSVK
jgi:aldose 1-epimerase